MNRRTVIGAGTLSLLPLDLRAQAVTDPEEFEQRITDLENRVTVIEQKLDELLGGNEDPEETEPVTLSETESQDEITLQGNGTALTDPVSLAEGMYRIEFTLSVDNGFGDTFYVSVAGSNDFDDQMFLFQFFEGDGEHTVSGSWEAKEDGEYAFDITCMSAWEMTISPL